MKYCIRFCFGFIAFVSFAITAHSQFVEIPTYDTKHPLKDSYVYPSSKGPSLFKGRYTITPDDNGNLNFDTVLAINLQSTLEGVFFSQKFVGGVDAAVLVPGKGIWQGTIGLASDNISDSLQIGTLFCIASNTKTFIAVIMMKLVEEGKVKLDDSLYKFLSPYPNIDSTITIRQLLSMRSGIFDYINDSITGTFWTRTMFEDPLRRWKPEEMLTQFIGMPRHAPGAKFDYTNTALIVAGMIIEKITGKKIASLIHEIILDPLKLNQTYFSLDDSLPKNTTHGYWYGFMYPGWKDLSAIPIDSRASSLWSAGNMYSTTENMARWIKKLYNNEILQRSSLQEMVKIYDSTSMYGLCTYTTPYYNMMFQGHDGSIMGSNSIAWYDLNSGISFVAHRNSSGNVQSGSPLFFGIVNAYLRTYKPSISLNTDFINIKLNNGMKYFDTTVVVKNIGGVFDSVYASVVPSTTEPESTYTVSPKAFIVQPGDSQIVTLRIKTDKWLTQRNHVGKIMIDAKFAYDVKHYEKQFQIAYTLDVKNGEEIPTVFSLDQNYPNPFNPTTTIRYSLPTTANVKLTVYDLLGREIESLVNEEQSAGWKEVEWNAMNVSSGIYFYKLTAGNYVEVKKLMVLK